MFKRLSTIAAVTISTAALATAAYADHHGEKKMSDNPMVGGAKMYASKNIVENAVNSADHETLVTAVTEAGLVETLSGEGPFTVFAPTDDAFAKLPDGTVETLLMDENLATLQGVLTCHVVSGAVMAEAVIGLIEAGGGSAEIDTLGSCTLTAALDGGNVTITDENGNVATVTIADVKQSNGVIHVIDTVLLPAG